jgi:hypothetical protein
MLAQRVERVFVLNFPAGVELVPGIFEVLALLAGWLVDVLTLRSFGALRTPLDAGPIRGG